MNRNSLLETSARTMHQFVRATLNKANVNSMLQELHIDGMNSDGRERVEQMQNFGFSASPLPRDEQEQQGGQGQQGGQSGNGGGNGGSGEQPKGPAAEAILAFIGGQRNHPVCIALDDRRHRPLGLKPGENAQYDDQGQMTLIRRGGLYMLSLDDDGSGQQPGAKMLKDKDGKATGQSQQQSRMVSLRHVQKKKQQRPQVGIGSGGGGGQKPPTAQQQQDYKHEGDSVNTEVRLVKNKISFYDGDTEVGHYDKDAQRWTHYVGGDTKKSMSADKQRVHIRFGGATVWVDQGGIWSTQPIQIAPYPYGDG